MGIGRRQFLKLFGSTVATAAASGGGAAFADELYVNRDLGFAFRKPPGWKFVSAREMQEQQAGQVLNLEDQGLAEVMGLPVVCACKAGITRNEDEFVPGVQFYYIEPDSRAWQLLSAAVDALDRLVDRLEGQTSSKPKARPKPLHKSPPVRKLQEDAEAAADLFKQFAVLEDPRPRIISNCPAAEYTASFLFEHRGLAESVTVRMRSLSIFPKSPLFLRRSGSFLIRMYDAPHVGPDDTEDYEPLIGSIRIM